MAKKVSDKYITSYTDDWGKELGSGLPYSGEAVQKFIKDELQSKVGYVARSQQKVAGFYLLYGFKNKAEYDTWVETPESVEPVFTIQLPNADTYEVKLETNSNTNKLVNLGEGVKVNIRYTSTSTPVGGSPIDTDDEGTLTIQRSYEGGAWVTVKTMTIQPFSVNTPGYQTIDITDYLLDGDNQIRMRVTDNVNGSVSPNVTFNSVVNTSLTIANALDTSKPLNSPSFSYFIQGQVAKTLHIKITPDGIAPKNYEYSLGETIYIETPYNVSIEDTYNTGTVTVESWLTVDDSTLESDHIINQFYYINGISTESVIILNNQISKVTNYVNEHFFDFTVYNKKSDVIVTITKGANTYLEYKYTNCDVEKTYEFYNTLEINSQDSYIDAVVTISTEDMSKSFNITIDNTENMNPTTGADFILNPKIRSNSEIEKNTIRNSAADGAIIGSSWSGFSFQDDGWCLDDNGVGVLRIPAGRTLTIDYDPYNALSSTVGTTIELDYKVYNVFDDNAELGSFKSMNGGVMLGFQMNTTEAYFMTGNNQVKRDQDIMFQDETRTHIAINIIPNLSNSGLNYIRIFVNGIMNREIVYTNTDTFKVGDVKMSFGGNNCQCDLDIYSIRVYKKSLSASDVRQDFMSSLPTSDEKIAFREMNNILAADGTISFDKASAKYNTLTWVGKHPEYSLQKVSDAGTLEINIIGDPEHSGTITNLPIKGQGSSSKTYWRWNHQYDMGKAVDPEDPTGTKTLDSIWTDGNGVEHKNFYILANGEPKMKKLVSKLNWASSQQSHKIGSTALYNDLWKLVVGGSGITKSEGYEKVRVAVHELPFLYFFKETPTSQAVFGGLVTFGSGKFDKPTFGIDYVKKEGDADFMAIEGSDNGMPLTMRQVPWIKEDVTYNEKEEYFEYAGQGSWDLDAGKSTSSSLQYFIDASNLTYKCSPYILPYTEESEMTDKAYQYWNTETYNVKRFDHVNEIWVDAGTEKISAAVYKTVYETVTENGEEKQVEKTVISVAPVYSVLNIKTQTGVNPDDYTEDDIIDITRLNNAFIAARKSIFKTSIINYYDKDDTLYSMAMIKLLAASDNWCKNTYEYLDPVDKKIRFAQDDLDTIMLTDNVGRKNKPYYVEEHDVNDAGEKYWNSDTNVFFVLMEQCFSSDYKKMMTSILNAMVNKYGSVDACLKKYYFDIQTYFPAVAYNETARLLYEEASVKQAAGIYKNNTTAISQSLGDQLQAEKMWWKRRIPYIQSWASSTPFNVAGQSSGSLSFRSVLRKNISNPSGPLVNPDFIFNVTPWQWLYPKTGVGQSDPVGDTRVKAGTVFTTPKLNGDGNTNIFIYGSDYYTNYGEFGGISLGESFPLNGNRLLEFSADATKFENPNAFYFRPTGITIACPSLRKLTLRGVSTLTGSLDLTNEVRLENIDVRGTNITGIILPESYNLKIVQLPETLTNITLNKCPNIDISYWSSVNYSNITSISTDNSTIAMKVIASSQVLNKINLTDIDLDFTNVSEPLNSATLSNTIYNALIDSSSSCSGHIKLDKELTSEEKNKLITKYNSIDDPNGALYIEYITVHSVPTLSGPTTIALGRSSTIDLSYEGNDIKQYKWVVEGADSYVVNASGVTVKAPTSIGSVGGLIKVTCTPIYLTGAGDPMIWNLTIINAIAIESLIINDMYIHTGQTIVPISYNPSNYTIGVKEIVVTTADNSYINRDPANSDKDKITYTFTSTPVTGTIIQVPVDIKVTDVENRIFTKSITLYVDNPITSWSIVDENDNEINID